MLYNLYHFIIKGRYLLLALFLKGTNFIHLAYADLTLDLIMQSLPTLKISIKHKPFVLVRKHSYEANYPQKITMLPINTVDIQVKLFFAKDLSS